MRAFGRSRFSCRRRIARYLRLKLIIPLLRSREPPVTAARSVAVGLFWAFTPTFGIQMFLCLVHWYVSRTVFRKEFNVVVAMAWTWVSNFFTLPFVYYSFFLVGQIALGRWEDLTGIGSFHALLDTAMKQIEGDFTSMGTWERYFSIIVEGWWLAMTVGCIPFAVLGYVFGFRYSLRLLVRWRQIERTSLYRGQETV